MKSLKRLKIALADLSKPQPRPKEKLSDWLTRQPGSTKRGVARGNFVLPSHVKP